NPILNDYSNSRSQIYEMVGDVRIHGKSSTIWAASDREESIRSWTAKPHPRLFDGQAMSSVTEINITMNYVNLLPKCTRYFHVPTIVFSAGGYSYHTYHGIADAIAPLYFTCNEFNGSVMLQLLDAKPWWISRYRQIFRKLSNYDTVGLAEENGVHCFSRVIVGLDADDKVLRSGPKHFTNHTMTDFTRFIRNTYSLERHVVGKQHDPHRLLIVSRKKTRFLLNQDEIAETCGRIGFEVETSEIEGDDLNSIARYINSFDVIVGVHGAGLTNMIFLPENALVIQIIPYGLRDRATLTYGAPATDMNLKYFEQEISWEESSLSSQYSKDDQVYIDPAGIKVEKIFRSIYL
ncbi:hypothetical protein M569_17310, partial [Genlisea aurea]